MNKVTKLFNTTGFVYGLFAIAVTAVMVFAVLPQMPQVESSFDKFSTQAMSVLAFGDSGDGGCCGGGDGGSGSTPDDGPDGSEPKTAKCVALTATPTKLGPGGGSVTFSWRTQNADGVYLTSTGSASDGPTSTKVNGSYTATVKETKTYTLFVYSNGGATGPNNVDTCKVKITVEKETPKPPTKPPAKTPSCDSFTVSPTRLPAGGGNVTVTWRTTNATGASLYGVGSVPVDGSRTIRVTENKKFTLEIWNAEKGDVLCQKWVILEDEPEEEEPAKCDFLSADRTRVKEGGEDVTLSWGTTNADSVSINNGVGSVQDDGSESVFVDSDTTFILTASNADGSDTCQVKITVDEEEEKEPKCDFLSANRTSLPAGGGNVTLTWETTNADAVSISGGIGSVDDDGSETVFVDDTITYVLTASGAGDSDTCTVKITVDEDEEEEKEPKCDFFRVSDDEVEEGDEVTLEWGTTNADEVSINNGIGRVSDDGEEEVEIDDDTTFILTVSNNGDEDTCKVSVDIEEEEDDKEAPRCDLEISDKRVKVGEEVTLEWDVRDAEEITIEDDRGNVIFRDRNPGSREDGEEDVVITRDTEFTLNAEGDGRDRECEVEVDVEDGDVLVLTERDQGKVAGISLTQVPYTGFEAGPALTFFFYALLTAWALVVAYMLVIKKDTVLGFSLAGASTGRVLSDEPVRDAYSASVAAPTMDIPMNLPVAPVAGYTSYVAEEVTEEMDELKNLEDHAHDQKILLSSDAMRYFRAHTAGTDEFATLDALIREAKASYPSEDGWVVLNLDRVAGLLESQSTAVIGAGSLAEAIATGNLSAAYQLIENRPMVALAEAAAELDAVYRMHQGLPSGTVVVSETLKGALKEHSVAELKASIDALTSALDGAYTDEAAAVKMAIMKAVNIFTA